MLQKGRQGQSPVGTGATHPRQAAAELHGIAFLRGTARPLARRCPAAHGHPLATGPCPAHPRPPASPALGHVHSSKFHFFHLEGPDRHSSRRKHVAVPTTRAALAAAFAQPLLGSQRSLRRSHPRQARSSPLPPRHRQAPSHGRLGPGRRADPQPRLCLSSLPAVFVRNRRAAFSTRSSPGFPHGARERLLLPAAPGTPAASLVGTHRQPPPGSRATAWPRMPQRSQKTGAAEQALQSTFQHKRRRARACLLPTRHFQ